MASNTRVYLATKLALASPTRYFAVSQKDEEASLKVPHSDDEPRRNYTPLAVWLLPLFVHSLIFVAYASFWYYHLYDEEGMGMRDCVEQTSSWSPALPVVDYQTKTFNGILGGTNKYMGTPTPEIDQAWAEISMQVPGVRLYEEDFQSMNKDLSSHKYHKLPEEVGGGYLGMTEVFHMLHCLDSLRKATYPEYYPETFKHGDAYQVRIHTDHCIDILRQRLMCTGDVGPVPFYDDVNPLNVFPLPDFSTTHTCRNFDALLEWSKTNDRALHWDAVGDLNRSAQDSLDLSR